MMRGRAWPGGLKPGVLGGGWVTGRPAPLTGAMTVDIAAAARVVIGWVSGRCGRLARGAVSRAAAAAAGPEALPHHSPPPPATPKRREKCRPLFAEPAAVCSALSVAATGPNGLLLRAQSFFASIAQYLYQMHLLWGCIYGIIDILPGPVPT